MVVVFRSAKLHIIFYIYKRENVKNGKKLLFPTQKAYK